MSVTCPRCQTVNPGSSAYCISCGWPLEGAASSAPVSPAPQPYASAPQRSYSPSGPSVMVEQRYKTLRIISTFLTVLAWIYLVGGVIGGIIWAIIGSDYYGGYGFFGVLLGILGGGLMFAMFKAYAELLHLAIDIEENTRRTAAMLERK